MKMFSALAMKEEEAVIPARRYLSRPRLALDCVRTAFSLLGFRLLLMNDRVWIIQQNRTRTQTPAQSGRSYREQTRSHGFRRGGALQLFECTYFLCMQAIFR
jgi:hypothetical protein